MEIFNKNGSKERLFEMMGNVNKVNLNEEFNLEPQNPGMDIVSQVIGQIKDGIVKITNSDSMKKENITFVELIGKDDKNNIVKMNLATEPEQGEMDGVFAVNNAELKEFNYKKSDGSETIVLDENGLRKANQELKADLVDIASRYVSIDDSEGTEEINDELYEDAVKWIDSVPYYGGTERMQTSKAYGDEKPTNPDVRVHSPELDQFVHERTAEPIDTDTLSGEDLLKAKISVLGADIEFNKLAQAYENFLKIKRINFEPSDVIQKALSAARDLVAEYLQQAKGMDVSSEDVQNFFHSMLMNKRSVVNEDGFERDLVLSREVILRAFQALLAEKNGQQPTREEVRDRANIMMRERQLAASRMNEEEKSNYPDPIGTKFKAKSNYPKKKKKPQTTVKVGEAVEQDDENEVDVQNGTEPVAPDVVNLDAEMPDTGQAPDFQDMPEPTPMPDDNGLDVHEFGDNPEDIEKMAQAKDDAGDQIPGGLADDKSTQEFCPHQLAKGLKVEMEHTDDPLIALEITMDHLVEDPKYYGDDDEDPDVMAQQGAVADAEKDADDEVADELLGFKPHNIGDIPEVPEDEEDKEETDELLGFKPHNVGDYEGGEEDVDEIQMVGGDEDDSDEDDSSKVNRGDRFSVKDSSEDMFTLQKD